MVLCVFSTNFHCLVAAFECYKLETLWKIKFGPNAELKDNNLDCKWLRHFLGFIK